MVIESEIRHSLESRSWRPTKDSRFNIFNFNRSKYLPERKMNIIHHKTQSYQAVNFLITFNPPLDMDTGQVSSKPRKPLKNSVLSRHIDVTLDLRIWLFGDLGNVFILVSQCALAQSRVTQWHLLIRQCRPPVMSTYVSLFCVHAHHYMCKVESPPMTVLKFLSAMDPYFDRLKIIVSYSA